jgi:hypothetical protein
MRSDHRFSNAAALEARLGARLASGLTARLDEVPHDVTERLRVARIQALARAAQVQRTAATTAAPAVVVVGSSSGASVLGGFVPWWRRAASLLPVLLLVLGLVLIEQWSTREQVLAAAEIDAQLLADDLPPSAYSDPGFAEYLRSSP